MRLPIVRGPLAGRWWLATSRGKILRILNGTYEPAQSSLFTRLVGRGDVVYDVGAHTGYYTLLSAALVGAGGKVCAFEPHPRNFAYLARHVAINRLENVSVERTAVCGSSGVARFDYGSGSGTGHLSADGAIQVDSCCLDDFSEAREVMPTVVKIDVEGAELAVLMGAERTVRSARPTIFLSTHGEQAREECLAWLGARGYSMRPINGGRLDDADEILCTP